MVFSFSVECSCENFIIQLCFMIHFKVFINKVFGLFYASCFSMCVFMFSVWESHYFSVKVSLFSVRVCTVGGRVVYW